MKKRERGLIMKKRSFMWGEKTSNNKKSIWMTVHIFYSMIIILSGLFVLLRSEFLCLYFGLLESNKTFHISCYKRGILLGDTKRYGRDNIILGLIDKYWLCNISKIVYSRCMISCSNCNKITVIIQRIYTLVNGDDLGWFCCTCAGIPHSNSLIPRT